MRYFLASIVDKNFKDYARDSFRRLNKYQRNIEFAPLSWLHFNYKLLGSNLSKPTLLQLQEALQTFVDSEHLTNFQLTPSKILIGKKSQLKPSTIKVDVSQNSGFLEFTRILHKLTVAQSDEIIKRKDNPNLIGIIKLGNIKPNTSKTDLKEIQNILKSQPQPEILNIDNICILSHVVDKSKSIYRQEFKLQLNKNGV